ncbi:MAG: ABC transporter permease [Rhodospirillales bacterium]
MTAVLLAARLARRELRSGLGGFRLFLACLAIGVAVIAGVGSLGRAITAGMLADARNMLGGDAELRLTQRAASADELRWLQQAGALSAVVELRAMAHAGDKRSIVELKAVDAAYPLSGAVLLDGAAALADALARRGGRWGAVADPEIAQRLGAKPGDALRLGEIEVELRAVIAREPDKGTSLFRFGPRVMVARAALDEAGLLQPGSLAYFAYRLALPAGRGAAQFLEETGRRFPQAGWRMRSHAQADPGAQRFIDRMTLFLTLVGLTALLVGGVGVGNSVKAHLDGKTATIATYKCLGAPGRLVFLAGLMQVMALAALGVLIGVVVGALVPLLAAPLLAEKLPAAARFGVYPGPLLLAAAFGLIAALAFSSWPLAAAREIPAAALFRALVAPSRRRPRWSHVALTALAALALAALALWWADDKHVAAWFVAGAAGTLAGFRLIAWGLIRAAAALPRPRLPLLRLALANVHRPGAPTASVLLSHGVGLSVLVAVALVEGNLARQVSERLPREAPSFYFIDIQPDQAREFDRVAGAAAGPASVQRVPTVRARIVKVAGEAADARAVRPEVAWVLRGDRALTYAAQAPANTRLVAGQWWPADYRGPPLVSFDAEAARGMNVGVGDTLTFNVLGREIEARIANLRAIDWTDLTMNFVVIFAPGTLETAPHTHIAAARVEPDREQALFRAVTDRFANVSAVRVRDALEAAAKIIAQVGLAVRVTSSVTILAGALVLAGAVAAGRRRRVYDAVVLKVLGATRPQLALAYVLEYGAIGLLAALAALGVGTLASYALVTKAMGMDWAFLPRAALTTAGLGVVLTALMGFAGTLRALGQKAAPLLRNP